MNLESGSILPPLVVLFLLAGTFVVSGHKYLETEKGKGRKDPVLVSNHQISWAAYEKLETKGQVDYYRFSAESGEEIYASLLVPKIDRLSGFSPDLALIGPGLEEAGEDSTGADRGQLDVKDEEGVLVKRYAGENSESFFEPFTQTNYWRHQVIRKEAPDDGTYHLAVWSRTKTTGKYVLAIGEKEDFGFSDVLEYPSVWWRVRIFNERKLSTYLITGAVLGGVLVGSYLLVESLF